MKNRISKAQIEVWKWKEDASKELSSVPSEDIIGFVKDKVADIKNKIKKIRPKITITNPVI